MKEEEQDKLLIEMSGDVKVILKTQQDHSTILFGPDGNSGATKDITLLKERQDKCPARKAATMEGKRFKYSTILVSVAIISVVINVGLFVIKIIKG